MKTGYTARKVLQPLIVGLLGCLLLAAANVEASPPEQIQFAKGATRSTWGGVIKDGDKQFKLRLAKGQTLMVGGDDVYSWHVITPKGTKLGCDGGEYCPPEAELSPLPDSGDYIIATHYRMSDCADCPTAKTRKVMVIFEAK